MPVVDWTRTDLDFDWSDGSKALRFDLDAFTAFDLFILKRQNTEHSKEQHDRAKRYFDKMSNDKKQKLIDTIVKGLPGRTSEAYSMDQFKAAVHVSIPAKFRLNKSNGLYKVLS